MKKYLFGSEGLTTSNNQHEFEKLQNSILDFCDNCNKKTGKYCQEMIARIHKYVCLPKWKTNRKNVFTNNNAESMNYIVKDSVDWRINSAGDLIDRVKTNIDIHYMDIKKALFNQGNYIILNFRVLSPIVWENLSDKKKDEFFFSFLKGKNHQIISKGGEIEIPQKFSRIARKPGSRKRSRASKTETLKKLKL